MNPTGRDRYIDFLRAWAIVCVVVGHWLITALVHAPGGEVTAPELLLAVPGTQWLTLAFQIMPLFFLAGGHAASGSWARAREAGAGAADWVGARALRLLLPAGAYSALALLALAVCAGLGVDPGTLATVGWALAMQFWFLPVYLLLSAATPVLHAAHRRWGVRVPAAMAVAALLVDVLVLAAGTPYIGPLNYILVWGVAYQAGFCWRDGLLTGRGRAPAALPAALTAGGALAFAALVALGPFPVSLILVTGQRVSNTDPPSAAMLAWTVAQIGLCLLLAPAVRRLLDRARVWRAVRPVGGASMTLYLWHMVPVLVVAAAFYLTGLAPQPALGSGGWWALRLPWLAVLGVVLATLVRVLRPWERGLTALYAWTTAGSGRGGRLWCGLALSTAALTRFAGHGFAPGGRVPVLPALGLALGVALVASAGRRRTARLRDDRSAVTEAA
ncbi:fucose 4-O-acetylase-like acetyltransferase [Streptomyces sp. B3I7]|uniref:acyltransferase family protein n=1 Tax=Streptomyces sp. B3I7 TaxID=3042269 RepID=UPI00277DB03F|nr:acyltransferase [Streptomyces sp. B3I7]MDQ0809149.1 fucose 4-O-acetylase-like acetyltransferase [Streptomyces sp. B3I7]